MSPTRFRPALGGRIASAVLLVALASFLWVAQANAAPLTSISLLQAQPEPGVTNNDYGFTFSNQSATPLRCIRIMFNTLPDGSGFTPPGFDATNASFSGNFMSSWLGWSTNNSTGTAEITRASATAPSAASPATLMLSGITNGSTPDTFYYALIRTYSNAACTTSVDSGLVGYTWTRDSTLSVTVDQSLMFSVAGLNGGACNGAPITGTGTTSSAISLGSVDKNSRAVGAQQLSIAANAGNGYSVYAHTTGPLSDGNGHSIAAVGGTNANPIAFPNPGTEGFGYTTDSSTLSGGSPDRFTTGGPRWSAVDGNDAEVMHSNTTTSGASDCVAYAITISPDTVGGYYGSSVVYTAVPSY